MTHMSCPMYGVIRAWSMWNLWHKLTLQMCEMSKDLELEEEACEDQYDSAILEALKEAKGKAV